MLWIIAANFVTKDDLFVFLQSDFVVHCNEIKL